MTHINPYLSFGGKCREAMTFYQQCLGGELSLQTVAESPVAAQCPAAMQEQIMHSTLTRGQLVLLGSDMGPGGLAQGNTVALCVNCSSEEEINAFFSRLSAGGQILDPLGVKFWGDTFGVLTDQFGVRWMFIYARQQA